MEKMSAVNRVEQILNRHIFWQIHIACLAVIWTGVSGRAVALAAGLYFVRMFLITGVYHRYFSHRSYKMPRWLQTVMAILGTTAVQRGPLWWAAHHRGHHKHSDTPQDPHSPVMWGFYQSHIGWFQKKENSATDYGRIRDFNAYPELRWIGDYHWVAPAMLASLCSVALGWQGLIVSFCWSTVALWHGTFAINSLAHVYGSRRYDTSDQSRNNWWLAILTLGEGWHNNHHHYMASARQGFFWWEIDISYYILWLMSTVGLVSGLRGVPKEKFRK